MEENKPNLEKKQKHTDIAFIRFAEADIIATSSPFETIKEIIEGEKV